MKKFKFEYVRLIIYIISIILTIFAALGKIHIECYWKENYGILCPACGLTRATSNIVRFNFKEAYNFNAFYTCVLIPFLFALVINDIFIIIKRKITKKYDISWVEIMLGEHKDG